MKQHTGRKIAILCVAAGLLCTFFILMAVRMHLAASQTDQFRNHVWSGDGTKYAQVSGYLSGNASLSVDTLSELRRDMDTALETASITPINAEARLWIDAYSTEATLTATSGEHTAEISATAVGGDFFFFHPLPLLSGYYFSEEELMHDRVIIDHALAWQFFGSYDVAGQQITINGQNFLIAAVAEQQDDPLFMASYGNNPHLYLPYSALAALLPDTAVTCYEAILPSPVSGFGQSILAQSFEDIGLEAEIIENSSRFSVSNLWDSLKSIGIRSMRLDTICYPYWENIAVVIQDRCALLFGAQLAAVLLFLIAAVIALLFFKENIKGLGKRLVPKHFKR